MATKKDYYSYALDENTHLIEIKYAAKGSEYRCPNCGAIMIPRQGKIRRWHFAHKANIENCSYETYLHKLAKMRIRECFNKSSSFSITFNVHVTCAAECPVGKQQSCTWIDTKEFNLKQYYDLCEEEVSVGKFKADLRLSHSKNKNREPILIEIWVTHKSTEEKCDSGYRIIEIHIESEDDINEIVSKKSINGSSVGLDQCQDDINDTIRFYNFSCSEMPDENHQSPKFQFWIYSMGGSKFNYCCFYDYSIKCLSLNPDAIETAIFRIDSDSPIDSDFAFCKLAESGLNIKFCTMCKFYTSYTKSSWSMCTLYKSKGTEPFPFLETAMHCCYFHKIDYDDIKQKAANQNYKITINNPTFYKK